MTPRDVLQRVKMQAANCDGIVRQPETYQDFKTLREQLTSEELLVVEISLRPKSLNSLEVSMGTIGDVSAMQKDYQLLAEVLGRVLSP